MIYTDCKWHPGSELPPVAHHYTIVWGAINSCQAYFDGKHWEYPLPVRFWSETPDDVTTEEKDYQAWIGISGVDGPAPDYASFAAGCRYARENK